MKCCSTQPISSEADVVPKLPSLGDVIQKLQDFQSDLTWLYPSIVRSKSNYKGCAGRVGFILMESISDPQVKGTEVVKSLLHLSKGSAILVHQYSVLLSTSAWACLRMLSPSAFLS